MKKTKHLKLALRSTTIANLTAATLSNVKGAGSMSINWVCSSEAMTCNSAERCSNSCGDQTFCIGCSG